MKEHSLAIADTAVALDGRNAVAFACGASRREFVKALGALAASTILPGSGLIAQTAPPATRAKRGRIDVHHHFLPPAYVERTGSGRAQRDWKPAASIEAMDQHGIETAIVSITTPGVWLGEVQESRRLARVCNEYGAQMVRDYPGRFGLFAPLPLPDQEGALREIEYAYDVLKADGVGLMSNYGEQWLGDPAFAPAFEELNRRNAIVFLHPTPPKCCSNLFPGAQAFRAEIDYDVTRSFESLLVNGTLERFPKIRFIVPHSGGVLPVMAGRMNDRFPNDTAAHSPGWVLAQLKKLYFEVAHATYPAPLAALTNFVPASQILFGTDFPVEPYETTTKPLAQFPLSPQLLQAMDRGNAERLFPRLKA